MSYYYREKPRFGDRVRDKGDDFIQKFKHHFDDDKSFFDRPRRDPFERHSAFGRGFGFDDDGFSRHNKDIRAHLDDLAARHPEFADHLLGPPWGDTPFHASGRRRGSGASHLSHQDDDARSQASGSSAASAASGASGVSSHGEPEPEDSTKIPQYGLRNTVDIGQHQYNMQNQDKNNRGQRSMSAPPENRNNEPASQDTQQGQNNNQRFVSRVDITPQFNNQTTEKSSKPQQTTQSQQAPPQKPQQQQQQPQTQSNVRHIPIFVEGRDKPVIPKDEPTFRQASPPKFHQPHYDAPPEFHSPPTFHRPSHFTAERFGGRPRDWPQFGQDPFQDTFDGIRRTHSPFRQQTERQNRAPESHFTNQHHPQAERPHERMRQQQYHQQPPSQQQQPKEEPPQKLKQTVPKDPLEKVALVQQEVDSLTEQVKQWSGESRQDKQYIYLDEMLTRELIKLDDIETEGREEVRQARKNAIKSIQDSIALLESKAPLPGQTPVKEVSTPPQFDQPISEEKMETAEPMETEKKNEEEETKVVIPLPAPSSPTKETAEAQPEVQTTAAEPTQTEETVKTDEFSLADPNVAIPMEAAPSVEVSTAMEVQTEPNAKTEPEKNEEKTKTSTKTPKKVKKAKQQKPVSIEPIPLPGPDTQQTNDK